MASLTNTGVERVKVELVYGGGANGEQSVVHDISGVRIVAATHNIVEKMQKIKDPETGGLIGHEPTGEYEVTIKVKYIKDI